MATAVDVEASSQHETEPEDRNWADYVLVYEQSEVEEDGKEEADRKSMRKTFEENVKNKGLEIRRLEGIKDTAQLVSLKKTMDSFCAIGESTRS